MSLKYEPASEPLHINYGLQEGAIVAVGQHAQPPTALLRTCAVVCGVVPSWLQYSLSNTPIAPQVAVFSQQHSNSPSGIPIATWTVLSH